LIFTYLPRAVADGDDLEAREHMANAATIAGLGFGNANAGLAHAMGHSFGGLFKQPHGRSVALYLPYTMEFTLNAGAGRYGDLARFAGLTRETGEQAAGRLFVERVRALQRSLGQPLSVSEMGINRDDYISALEKLCDFAEMDTQMLGIPRVPERGELEQLFTCAYDGSAVEF
jgi:acetaldehyde dehydrogenase/alcohol dehydrogenase